MSKEERLEIGDIYMNKQNKSLYLILAKPKDLFYCLINGGGMVSKYESEFDNYQYIGKTKVKLTDLFEWRL